MALSEADRSWASPSRDADWSLSYNQGHLWRVPLIQPPHCIEDLQATLSPDEHGRAERLINKKQRDRYIITRSALRQILARYLSLPASHIRFQYSEHGKPKIDFHSGQHGKQVKDDQCHEYSASGKDLRGHTIQFNVSHSHDLAIIAVSTGHGVGVDVEYLHRPAIMDRMKIAERMFSTAEKRALGSFPKSQRDRAFLACWTRKEAVIKALGTGLFHRLDRFDVSVDPDEPARLLGTRWESDDAPCWTMASLPVEPDYIGALAVRHPHMPTARREGMLLSYWQWESQDVDISS